LRKSAPNGGAFQERNPTETISVPRLFAGLLLGTAATINASAAAETHTLPEDAALYNEWGLSGVVRQGDTLYLSGVVAGLRDGETDPEAAFERAFAHIERTLKLAGASWSDVIEMTTFHTDIGAQMTVFRKVKDRYVREPFSAWTAVGVTRLVPLNGLAEIKVVARVKAR
jgi:enamine deaminase RidA (YjgF/YER057c/UK114 family)